MDSKAGNIILVFMIVGAILGVIGGYYFGDIFIQIKFLGTIFLNALKMVVIPLIVASMIVGVTTLGDIRKLGRTSGKTLLYYFATTGFSVLIGLILVNILRPGEGVPLGIAVIPELVEASRGKTFIDVIVGMVPDNIFGAAADGKVLPLIVFSLLFGGVLTTIGAKGKPVISFFEGLNKAIMKIVTLILYFAPVGVFALIGGIVADNRGSVDQLISGLGMYTLTVILGLLVHAIVILPLILHFFTRRNPLKYFANMGQALATAFTTASSSATLPITFKGVEDKNRVDPKASSFVLPLGATINMDGTALYEAVAALFIAQIYGIDLSIGAQVIIFLTATLASIGAAGIPHAGTVTMVFVLTAVGLPLEGIGLIWAIDWFLDRCRTTVNVWGDSIGAAVIGETAEIKTKRRIAAKSQSTSRTASRGSSRADKGRGRYDRKTSSTHVKSSGRDRHKSYGDRDKKKGRYSDRPDRSGRSDHKGKYNGDKLSRPKSSPKSRPNGKLQKAAKPAKTKSKVDSKTQIPKKTSPETLGPDLRVKVKQEHALPSKATINRELEKVRKHLDKMEHDKTEPSFEKNHLTGQKSEDYFDMDVSKIDFFSEDPKPSDKTPPVLATDSDTPSKPAVDDKKEDKGEQAKSVIDFAPEDNPEKKEEPIVETVSEPIQETPEQIEKPKPEPALKIADNDSGRTDDESDASDMWGRGRKKKPSR